MSLILRLLVPLSVAVVLAAVAPAAHAATTVTFPAAGVPVTTVEITDPGAGSTPST